MTPPLSDDGSLARIDVDPLHGGKVDHHTAVDGCPAGDVVAAAADGNLEVVPSTQLHRVDNIGDTRTAGNHRRPLVDHAVMKLSCLVVPVVVRRKELSREGRSERFKLLGKRR